MKITQGFRVDRPVGEVWAALADVPGVASCLPGAEITADKGEGAYAGKVSVKLGPFSAAFDGEATVTRNEAGRTGRVEGKGVDKRGGSRSRMTMDYRVVGDGTGARVEVDADVILSGPIAQFGRIGLMQETANILVRDFARNLEGRLAAAASGDAAASDAAAAGAAEGRTGLDAFTLLWRLLLAWLGRMTGRRPDP